MFYEKKKGQTEVTGFLVFVTKQNIQIHDIFLYKRTLSDLSLFE